MLYTLCILLIFMTIITYAYHRYQNTTKSIGGSISAAKSFWLAYVLFHYFIYPLFLYFLIDDAWLKGLLLLIAVWFYLRMFIQGFMMFISHNWTPQIGITHNLITAFLLTAGLAIILTSYFQPINTEVGMVSFFVLNLVIISVTDTLYAYRFSKIVGNKTKGKEAVWYASNTQEFGKINRMTRRNNYFFVFLSGLLIAIIVMYYDKY